MEEYLKTLEKIKDLDDLKEFKKTIMPIQYFLGVQNKLIGEVITKLNKKIKNAQNRRGNQ